MATGPIVPTYTRNVDSVLRKYQEPEPILARELSRATPDAISAAQRYDRQRLTRGQRGLTAPQTAVGIRAASTGETSIGEPDRGIVGDFVNNVEQFATGLPRLPLALGNEILDLPKAPQAIQEGIAQADSPIEAVGNVANAPGVRMVPGAFVAGQFGTGGPGVQGLVDNPLFTALDVLPYASKAASLAPGVKAAQAAVDAAGTGERVGRFSSAVRYTGRARETPIAPNVNAVRGATVREAVEPTRLGLAAENLGAKARGTRVGNLVSRTWGKGPMDASQVGARVEATLNDPRFATTDADRALIETRLAAQEQFAGIERPRAAAIAEALRFGDDLDQLNLSKVERDYIATYKERLAEIGRQNLESGEMMKIDYPTPGGGVTSEFVPRKVGQRILKARANRSKYQAMSDAHAYTRGETSLTPEDFAGKIRGLADEKMTVAQKRRVAASYLRSGRAQGFDVGDVKLPSTRAELDATLRGFTPPTVATTRATPQAIRQSLMTMARTDTQIAKITELIKTGDFQAAGRVARQVASRRKFTGGMDWASITDDLSAYASRQRAEMAMADLKPDRMLKQAERSVARVEAEAPARFSDVIGRRASDRMISQELPRLQQEGVLTPDEASSAAALLADGLLDEATVPPALRSVWRKTQQEVKAMWLDMVDEGLDPTFVHRVSASKVGRPVQITGRPMTVTQLNERVFDFGNTVNDVMVALDHQAMELLHRRGTERFMTEMESRFGRSWDELRVEYTDWARLAKSRNPSLNLRAHLEAQIKRNWGEIQIPETVLADGTRVAAHRTWVPKQISDTLHAYNQQSTNIIARAFDPVMNVFRTALLPLSVRWHLYNMTGGAIMATAEGGLKAWKQFPRALRMARGMADDVVDLTKVEGLPPMAMGKIGREIREGIQFGRTMDLSSKAGKATAVWEFGTGRFLRRVLDEVGGKFKSGVDKSYLVNEFFDDAYRTMMYLHGFDDALAKGMKRAAAEQAGVASARKVLQSWDRMTPIERTVVRSVFPFYSWAKHLLGFVTRYPFDHPIRTSITASLIQAELDDYATGLPQMFFGLIDITGPAGRLGITTGNDEERIMLNLSGMNPFRDVGSYATFLGFMASPITGEDTSVGDISAVTSQMNPAAQVFLRMVGVDPSSGLPDPYADVSYDPSTGGLRMDNPFNPLLDPIQSIVPQTKAAFDLMGVNRDYQQMVLSNPEAAQRRLMSSVGLPVLARGNFDPGVEIIKAETRRLEDMQRTKNEALKSGDLDMLLRYPQLRPLYDQLKELEASGDLDAVRPTKEDVERRMSPLNR